jgi:hypothetical protein
LNSNPFSGERHAQWKTYGEIPQARGFALALQMNVTDLGTPLKAGCKDRRTELRVQRPGWFQPEAGQNRI